jgi:hypothetical protein
VKKIHSAIINDAKMYTCYLGSDEIPMGREKLVRDLDEKSKGWKLQTFYFVNF